MKKKLLAMLLALTMMLSFVNTGVFTAFADEPETHDHHDHVHEEVAPAEEAAPVEEAAPAEEAVLVEEAAPVEEVAFEKMAEVAEGQPYWTANNQYWYYENGELVQAKVESEKASDPTCAEPGKITYNAYAKDADPRTADPIATKTIDDVNAPATGNHTAGKPVKENAKDASCTEAGSHEEVVYCTVCNKELSREKIVDEALGHDVVRQEGQTIKAEKEGEHDRVEYQLVCSRCGEVQAKGSDLVHVFGDWTVTEEGDCFTDKVETRTCKLCDETETQVTKAPGKHTKGEPVKENIKEATCTEPGSYDEVIYCANCGEELSRTKDLPLAADGHVWGKKGEVTKEATCTEGEMTYTCINCGATKTEKIPAVKTHTPATDAKEIIRDNTFRAVTCTQDGMHWLGYRCKECGEWFDKELVNKSVDPTLEAKGHEPKGEGVITKAPTHTKDGEMTYTCKNCGESYTEVIHATGTHYWVKVSEKVLKEGSCEKQGLKEVVYECTDPTCTVERKVEQEAFAGEGHKWGEPVKENIVDATCTKAGTYETVVYCTVCGAEQEGSRQKVEGKALDHDFQVVEESTIEPTCTEAGSRFMKCTRCGEVKVDEEYAKNEGAAKGHVADPKAKKIKEDGVAATCTEDGYHFEFDVCKNCGEKMAKENVEDNKVIDKALGHEIKMKTGELSQKATCTEDGYGELVFYCTRGCKECEKSDIPAEYQDKVELNKDGKVSLPATIKDQVVPALGHDMVELTDASMYKAATCTEDGYATKECSRCGAKENVILPKLDHKTADGKSAIKTVSVEVNWFADENSNGTLIYKDVCSICGAETYRNETFSFGAADTAYTIKRTEKAHTCTEPGEFIYTFSQKGLEVINPTLSLTNKDDPAAHTPADAVKDPADFDQTHKCDEKGTYELVTKCSVCGEELSRYPVTVEATDHQSDGTMYKGDVVKEGSHIEDRMIEYYKVCDVCGEKYDVEVLPDPDNLAPGHVYGDIVQENVVAPTCTEAGSCDLVTYCKDCGEKYVVSEHVPIKALGHKMPSNFVIENDESDCTHDDFDRVWYCANGCGKELKREHEEYTYPKTYHSVSYTKTDVVVKEPTCTEPGAKADVSYCSRCFEEVSRGPETEIPALGHKPGEAVRENEVAATSTSEGSYESVVYCVVCGEELSRETVTTSALLNGAVLDEDGIVRIYKDGEVDTSVNGIYNAGDLGFVYVENGVQNMATYGFVDFDGGKFLVANGTVATHINGLAQDPNDTDTWYFLSNGQAQLGYDGPALYDGAWFLLKDGKLDTTFSGVTEYDGGKFLVGAGRFMTEVSGLCQDPATGTWYFFANGQVQDYTGNVEYDGAKFHITHGVLDA